MRTQGRTGGGAMTIEVQSTDQTTSVASDRMILIPVCVLALLGLGGIVTMTG
jgi:hypothetical protein